MSETVVRNKKLLITALLLAVLAMVLVYAYLTMQSMEIEASQVKVLKWRVNRTEGQEITKEDISAVEIPVGTFEELKNVVKSNPVNIDFIVGGHLSRDAKRNDFVRFSDMVKNRLDVPSRGINDDGGFRAFPLRVDPQRTVGDLLRVNDRIDIIGLISIGGKPARGFTMLENVRVLAVGGRSESPGDRSRAPRRRAQQNLRVYRTLAIELQIATAIQMAELLPRVRGKIWIVLRHPDESDDRFDGKLNPKLLPVLDEPLPEDIDLD